MRLSIRRCVNFLAAAIGTLMLCIYALRTRVTNVASKFEFLEHALYSSGGRLYEVQDDGTGGWLTRWFPALSRPRFLENGERQPAPVQRCPVYTYIDTTVHRHGSIDFDILQTWMRAFWALGFKPVVLTDKDTRRHSHYALFRKTGLFSDTGIAGFGKWPAMAQYGGLFVDYRVIPSEFLGIKFLI
jgi:hypothetical protein